MNAIPWQMLIYGPLISYGHEVAPRGQRTKELLNWQFKFSPEERFIFHKRMPMNLEYFARELAWYAKGDKYDLSIVEHAAIWKDMVNDDGTLTSNYGHLLWGEGGGLRFAVDELKNRPDSRRAVAHINHPEHLTRRDIPCTMYFQFLIRGGQLHTMVYMRSQDAVYGLRNDLPFFWFVSDVVGRLLGKHAKYLYLSVGSFHVYERHFDKVQDVVNHPEEWLTPEIEWEEELQRVCAKLA